MWSLRYVARSAPSGPTCTEVLAPRPSPASAGPPGASAIEPATGSISSSAAIARAQLSAGPSSGSAPDRWSAGVPYTDHFSGRTTSAAPSRTAARTRRSAVSRLVALSAVAVSWTAAARTGGTLRSSAIDWSVNRRLGAYPGVSTLHALPARDRPTRLPLPPARMALVRDRRPLKRWRYLGLYGEDLMLCAADVRIAGLPQAFWATWDRRHLREKTVFRPGGVALGDEAARFGPADLRLQRDGDAMTVTSRHGDSYIWTRKQPVRATGTVGGRAIALRGLVDDSAGYHARRTDWQWCAGVGEAPDGTPLAFNVVAGVHDAPVASERTLWVAGAARELPPAVFAG